MTKKPIVKQKGSSSKLSIKKTVTSTKKPEAKAQAQTPKNPAEDPRYTGAFQSYELALKSMQAQKFDKAKPLFEKAITTGPKELADRATVHLNICNQQLNRVQTQFKTPEEHYDYAVSLMNMGDFVSAREHFEQIAKKSPDLDFAWYGLAVLECLTGHTNESLQHLAEAIRLSPNNRFQARNDSDFRNMAEDPRFTELLYPEGTTA